MSDRIPERFFDFTLLEALLGRRARRFSMGARVPDGPLAFESRHSPLPLSEEEKMVVLAAAGGSSGWHFAITRNPRYAPRFPNYSAAAGGRTFPSAAGFHTSEMFFTDDSGVYFFPMRDSWALRENGDVSESDFDAWLEAQRKHIRKISDQRLQIPREEPHFEGHNTWCVNLPGSLLLIPVADLAQHLIAILCFMVQNGYCFYDDFNGRRVPGIAKFGTLVDTNHPFPLSYIEQYGLTEVTAELATSCYAGMLALQAMGLGGWMFDGLDRHSVFGVSGDPRNTGLGFRADTDPRWALPNPTGLPGVFEAFCPPRFPDMSSAVEAFCERKFGPGGPFHQETPGSWKDSRAVRSSAEPHDQEFKDCVSTMAQYIFDTFGKFPGTVPSVFSLTYLQAHHLDLEFYDRFFKEGSYLPTHANHDRDWH